MLTPGPMGAAVVRGLRRPLVGMPLAIALLVGPPVLLVGTAIGVAGFLDPAVDAVIAPVSERAATWPFPMGPVVGGRYGLLTMGILLVVWAVPVAAALALALALLGTTGLVDHLALRLDPLTRRFGLEGRDLVAILAGHGCNVPAIVGTRACSTCTRDATVAVIGFGAACSYQLAATLGVLAAAGRPWLMVPYMGLLGLGSAVVARSLRQPPPASRPSLALPVLPPPLALPTWQRVRTEAAGTLAHVTVRSLPVFGVVIVAASLLAATGALDRMAGLVAPLLGVLRLPGEAALPLVLGSVRKDGLLLLAEPGLGATLDSAQLLASLVLAGALTPCLVTVATVVRERGAAFTARLVARQAGLAATLAAAVSWSGALA